MYITTSPLLYISFAWHPMNKKSCVRGIDLADQIGNWSYIHRYDFILISYGFIMHDLQYYELVSTEADTDKTKSIKQTD